MEEDNESDQNYSEEEIKEQFNEINSNDDLSDDDDSEEEIFTQNEQFKAQLAIDTRSIDKQQRTQDFMRESDDSQGTISPPMDYNKWKENRLKKLEDYSKILSSNQSQSIDEGMFSNRKKESQLYRHALSSQKKYDTQEDGQVEDMGTSSYKKNMYIIDQESSQQESDSQCFAQKQEILNQNKNNIQQQMIQQNESLKQQKQQQQTYLGKNLNDVRTFCMSNSVLNNFQDFNQSLQLNNNQLNQIEMQGNQPIVNQKHKRKESALEKNYNKPLQMVNSGSPPNQCKRDDIYPNPFKCSEINNSNSVTGIGMNNTQFTSSFGLIANEMNQITFKNQNSNNMMVAQKNDQDHQLHFQLSVVDDNEYDEEQRRYSLDQHNRLNKQQINDRLITNSDQAKYSYQIQDQHFYYTIGNNTHGQHTSSLGQLSLPQVHDFKKLKICQVLWTTKIVFTAKHQSTQGQEIEHVKSDYKNVLSAHGLSSNTSKQQSDEEDENQMHQQLSSNKKDNQFEEKIKDIKSQLDSIKDTIGQELSNSIVEIVKSMNNNHQNSQQSEGQSKLNNKHHHHQSIESNRNSSNKKNVTTARMFSSIDKDTSNTTANSNSQNQIQNSAPVQSEENNKLKNELLKIQKNEKKIMKDYQKLVNEQKKEREQFSQTVEQLQKQIAKLSDKLERSQQRTAKKDQLQRNAGQENSASISMQDKQKIYDLENAVSSLMNQINLKHQNDQSSTKKLNKKPVIPPLKQINSNEMKNLKELSDQKSTQRRFTNLTTNRSQTRRSAINSIQSRDQDKHQSLDQDIEVIEKQLKDEKEKRSRLLKDKIKKEKQILKMKKKITEQKELEMTTATSTFESKASVEKEKDNNHKLDKPVQE
ncbi:UNKNOWN [Stylonychia lemnae]|uniref:Uncharacterized protein n=1 Tax=Stylonychia lemnae TaxID=5949 RepID=A0A078B1N5_STYLE|nr:UNKNOWN [Stylonychia lemnae]|eukprot:CDW88211.1 UNKNOWN [Stylonychia lemnae]